MAPELHRPMPDLPPEIQFFHILPKLPVKSILRFMCVSKEWRSFLRSPEFMKMHINHATAIDHQNHHMLLISSTPTTQPNFCTIDCEAPEDGLTVSRPLPFQTSSDFIKTQFLTFFHGLVCVGILDDNNDCSHLILWNPSTGEHKTLSKGRSHKKCVNNITQGTFRLYYSSVDDNYRLLRITEHHEAYVYSLNSDSWRKLKPTCISVFKDRKRAAEYFELYTVVLNEKLYFLRTMETKQLIVVFDIKTEKFTQIEAPSYVNGKQVVFRVVKGCIHFYVFEDAKMELWKMDGDGDWTRMGSSYVPKAHSVPMHLMRNGDWLMDSRSSCLHRIDSKTCVSNLVCSYAKSGFVVPFLGLDNFIETLVSPNRKKKKVACRQRKFHEI